MADKNKKNQSTFKAHLTSAQELSFNKQFRKADKAAGYKSHSYR